MAVSRTKRRLGRLGRNDCRQAENRKIRCSRCFGEFASLFALSNPRLIERERELADLFLATRFRGLEFRQNSMAEGEELARHIHSTENDAFGISE